MIRSQPEYKPGDPAWIKLDRCPWWPSLVVQQDECPVEPRPNATIIACIHFTPEEEFDIIYSKSKILPWEKGRNRDLMAKALRNLKNKEEMKKKFMDAITSLSKQCNIEVPKISKSELKPKPCYYQILDENRRDVAHQVEVPKAGSFTVESTDHNHLQQAGKDGALDELSTEPNLSERDTKKRCQEVDTCQKEQQPAKKAKVSTRKKLAKDLDHIMVADKTRNLQVDDCDSDNESLEPLPPSQPDKKQGEEDEVDSDSDSDDEDLPDVLSSCTKDPVKEGTLLWVKVGKWPFWPAIVKNCYRRKKVLLKVSLVFIGDAPTKNGPGASRACLRYNKKTMMAFADQERHNQLKEEGLKTQYSSYFHEAVSKTEDFLFKKCLGAAKCPFAFFAEDISKATGGPDPTLLDLTDVEDEEGGETQDSGQISDAEDSENVDLSEENPDEDLNGEDNSSSDDVEIVDVQGGGSVKLKLKKEKRRERGARMIAMIKTPQFKAFLFDIYHEKRQCDRHDRFLSVTSHRERVAMRQHGFGPIDDEDQQMEIVSVLSGYMKELCGDKFPDMAYIFDVWLPETLIRVMQKIAKKTREFVEELFFRGPVRTKEEKKIQHDEIMETSKNIDPEDIERYRAKLNRVQAELCNNMSTAISSEKSAAEQSV